MPTKRRVCVACGRVMPRGEGNVSGVGDLCHPDDPNLRDCYHRWTVYGEHDLNETIRAVFGLSWEVRTNPASWGSSMTDGDGKTTIAWSNRTDRRLVGQWQHFRTDESDNNADPA